jgi:hypothetical protein
MVPAYSTEAFNPVTGESFPNSVVNPKVFAPAASVA